MGTEEISFGGEGGSVEPEPTVYPVYSKKFLHRNSFLIKVFVK